jgi:hypothetical protein
VKCPYGKRTIDPCKLKVYNGGGNPCQDCINRYRAAQEATKPRPPAELVDALQDRPASLKTRPARAAMSTRAK